MRYYILITTFLFWTVPSSAEPLEAFKARIESAYQSSAKEQAVKALFYQKDLNDEDITLLQRTVKQISNQEQANVNFLPVPEDTNLIAVVNGFEYRPNLEVIGFVDIGDNGMGGTTKIPYGKASDGKYYFTATTKKLVNPDAGPDKLIQIIVVGQGDPSVTFEGWCDILLSNNETEHKKLDDQGVGNQTLIVRGQKIEKCQITNTSDKGSVSLRLLSDDDVLFEQRVKAPDNTISYP